MFLSILVAIDGWENIVKLLDLTKCLCNTKTKVEIIFIDSNVGDEIIIKTHPSQAENISLFSDQQTNQQLICDALEYLRITGNIKGQGIIVGGEDPASAILKYAKRINSNLIIVGHRHLSLLSRLFEPSVALKIVRSAHCPVLVDSIGELNKSNVL